MPEFAVGDLVKIISGDFQSFEGRVKASRPSGMVAIDLGVFTRVPCVVSVTDLSRITPRDQ